MLRRSFALATNIDVHFCDPRRPWQRDSNDNTNSFLRHFFRTGTDFNLYSAEAFKHVANLLNGRPCKTLDWRTPVEC